MSYLTDDNLVSRIYSNFRGVDFRGEEINLVRSPDSLNVWKDYKETESIRTRPLLTQKASFEGNTIYGIFFYHETPIVHVGTKLFSLAIGENAFDYWLLFEGLNEAASDGFVYEDVFYFKDGKHYLKYDGKTIGEVEGYIPTTSISRKAQSGGTMHQDANMLSPFVINTFLSDGKSKEYWLDRKDIDPDFAPVVEVDGEVVSNYTVDYKEGKIIFDSVVSEPLTDGQDNIKVKFKRNKKITEEYRDCILGSTLLQVFDNRVFFSGNKEFPNVVWHCSLNDPSYVSDTDYYREGLDDAEIKGIVAGNNALWVFREPSDANTTAFYHTPSIDGEGNKIYPSSHSSISTGCVGKAINFNDDIVFFSERGMEGISGDVTTEQMLGHRSTLVDRKMIAEPNYKDMILAEWEGYLFVFIGNKAFLADSRATFTNENHLEYDWFYWELPYKVTCAKVIEGLLYLGTEDGRILTFTEKASNLESNIESYWVTPKDKFKYPQRLKTTNKRGCVIEATGDLSIYAKIEDTDFELISTHENITDYCVSRIKRKKFKDIQLKFHSQTRFSLETATLECFVGGYIKR